MKKLLVLKIGTKSIVDDDGHIRKSLLDNVAENVYIAHQLDWRVIIVSSGAIACGKMITKKELSNQAYAGIGQPELMIHWKKAFAKRHITIAQGLYANKNLERKENRESATKVLYELLDNEIVPVVNENDLITDAEVRDLCGFGDNDQLASLIARAKNANLLIYLTTVPGVINPYTDRVIPKLSAFEHRIEDSLQSWDGDSNGGMRSKLQSAKAFVRATKNSRAIITSFREKDILCKILIDHKTVGTEIS